MTPRPTRACILCAIPSASRLCQKICSPCATSFARPKSSNLAPALVSMTLPGFRSRWMTPCRCAAASASAISVAIIRRAVAWQRSLLQALCERFAGQVFHDQEHRAFVLANIVQAANVRVARAGDGSRFTLEPGAAIGVGTDVGRQEFDGDGAVQPGVACLVHFTHSARADGRLDFVRPEARSRRQTHVKLRHVGLSIRSIRSINGWCPG